MIYLEKPADFKSKFDIVSCFLEREGKFLLLHRQDTKPQGNTWGVPAGKVENHETPAKAMIRELEEETGYAAAESELFLSTAVFVRYPEYDFVYYIYSLPLDKHHEVIIEAASHKSFEWVTPQEALVKNLILDEDACIKLHYGV